MVLWEDGSCVVGNGVVTMVRRRVMFALEGMPIDDDGGPRSGVVCERSGSSSRGRALAGAGGAGMCSACVWSHPGEGDG